MNEHLTDKEKWDFKKRLYNKCLQLIRQRINAASKAIAEAQAAANAEERSSAGDKYETSRAMSHLEKDMQSRQLSANHIELVNLSGIDYSALYKAGTKGSFIQCDGALFFIAAGLGKINFEGDDIYLLSPNAPVAKLLFNKRKGDTIIFNKINLQIKTVF